MKFTNHVSFVGLLVCVALVSGTQTENRDEHEAKLQGIIDDLINKTINALLENIEDPIQFTSLPFNFTEELLNGEANISNFQLYGLKELAATKIDVSVLTLAMNATIVIPQIKVNTDYYADVKLAKLFPLFGEGQINVEINVIELLVGGKVNLTGGLSLSNVTVSIALGNAKFDLQGLLNNEEFSGLLNDFLDEYLVPFINDNRKAISDIISPLAGAIINNLLSGGKNFAQQNELEEALHESSLQNLF